MIHTVLPDDWSLTVLPEKATKCLIRLPKSFVELYSIVNKVKGRDNTAAIDDTDDAGSTETAICLLTGAVMRSGAPRRPYSRTVCQTVRVSNVLQFLTSIFILIGKASWSMHPTCTSNWVRHWHLFLGPEMHSTLDAQQQVSIFS